MKYNKKLSTAAINILNSRTSLPTVSIPPGSLLQPQRSEYKNHAIAELIGSDQEFSQEYIAKNKDGEEILKSDKFIRTGSDTYAEVPKSQYNHHHIKGDTAIEDRLNSIIDIEKK